MPGDGPLETCLVIVTRRHGDRDDVLLGTKRRGFGTGRLVLPGGKVDAGETPHEAAARELLEETGLAAGHLSAAGIVDFAFPHDASTRDMRAHVFATSTFTGEVRASDEMSAHWIGWRDIDYAQMWSDARHWLPRALDGTLTRARFVYDRTARSVESFTLDCREAERS